MARASLYALTALFIGRTQELFKFLGPMRIVLIVGAVCVISALMTSPAKRQPVLKQREVRIILAMGGLAVLLLPFSVWPGGSLSFLVGTYSKLVVLCILIVMLATDPRVLMNLVWAVLIGMGVLGIFTLVAPPMHISSEYAFGRAYASSTYDPNDDAMMMAITLPLAALGAAALRGVGRLGAASVAAICVLSIIRTVSRGGFVTLALVSLLLLSRLRSAGTRLVAVAAIAAVLAAAPVAYWHVMDTIWKPVDAASAGYVEQGIWSRMAVWSRALGFFLRNPLTGVGIGTYGVANGLMFGRNSWVAAHNSFLQIAAELGLIGFALFVALLVYSIGNARMVQRAARADPRLHELAWIAAAVEISLYAYMVGGFALSQAYTAMLYFLVGAATALRVQMECHRRTVVSANAAMGGPSKRPRKAW